MATVVGQTAQALAEAWEQDIAPALAGELLAVALADATAGHGLTITYEEGPGERSIQLGSAGDSLVLPLHGINHVRIEAAAYPTTVLIGIIRAGAELRTGINRTT